jgi:hypothetical protein
MPVTLELIHDDRVVLQTYSDPLSAADFYELKNRMEKELLPAAAAKLHVIADFRQVHNLPGTMLSSGTRMLSTAHPNTGTIIAVTQSAFVSRMAQIFSHLAARHQFRAVPSLDEALALMNQTLRETERA